MTDSRLEDALAEIEKLRTEGERLKAENARLTQADKRSDLYARSIQAEMGAEIEQLKAVIRECGAEWRSEPGTVMSTAGQVAREFQRRMELAANALERKP